MNIEKRLKEIDDRKLEIRQLLESDVETDLDEVEKELVELEAEAKELRSKKEIAEKIQTGEVEARKIEEPEVEKSMDREDILASKEYRSAFFKRLLGRPLNEVEERAYTSADNSAGAVIPVETANMIFEKMVKVAPMLSQITLLRVAGNVKFAIEGTRNPAAVHAENDPITPAADALTYVTLAGYEYAKVIRISKTVSTMAIDAFESWLVNMLAEDIARAIEDAIINGDGSTEPKGIEHANTWDLTNAVLVNPTDGVDFDDIMDLMAMLPNAYMSNAKFLCNNKMFYGSLAKVRDADGMPIYVKDMEAGVSFRIMGLPVILSDYVVDNTLYFGDFTKVVGNLSQDISVESSTQSGFLANAIDFRGTAIFDCDIAIPDAFRKLYVGTAL